MTNEYCKSLLNSWGIIVERESSELFCKCPLHDDRRPSMSVNPEKELWHCFSGCGGGHLRELALLLGKDYNTPPQVEFSFPVLKEPIDFEDVYSKLQQLKDSPSLLNYVQKRGIDKETYQLLGWRVDYFSGELCYPVTSLQGEVKGILRHKPGGKPISGGFPKSSYLYGFYETRCYEPVVVIEGPYDAAKVSMAGYRCAGIMGSSLSPIQAKYLIGEDVVILTDFDEAGFMATQKIVSMLGWQAKLRIADWTQIGVGFGADPGSITVEQIKELVENSEQIRMK